MFDGQETEASPPAVSPRFQYGSVCSGIEAATVAWHPLGWTPAFFSEIEPFPSAVLSHHYPHVPNFGDMTKFVDWPNATINLLVGGTPCQSFSVAGLRGGLADPRGNLALTYLAVADRYRPEWLVWENVPGVLSSNRGRDFGSFLGGLGELGYGFAYRVLDAQYVRVDGFGRAVPQRRRRVFVVGHLGDWRPAAAVLFERESLCGNAAPRREARQDVAPTLSARTKGGGGLGTVFELDGGLVVHAIQAGALRENPDSGPDGVGVQADIAYTLEARSEVQAVHLRETVRRLTPRECERLQGFPDDYSLIRYRGRDAADGPRYKALGNSMAVNVMRWVGSRVEKVRGLMAREIGALAPRDGANSEPIFYPFSIPKG